MTPQSGQSTGENNPAMANSVMPAAMAQARIMSSLPSKTIAANLVVGLDAKAFTAPLHCYSTFL
jgi:hypothetical protein